MKIKKVSYNCFLALVLASLLSVVSCNAINGSSRAPAVLGLKTNPLQAQEAICLAFSELAKQRNISDYYSDHGSFKFGPSRRNRGDWVVTFRGSGDQDGNKTMNDDLVITVQSNGVVNIFNLW